MDENQTRLSELQAARTHEADPAFWRKITVQMAIAVEAGQEWTGRLTLTEMDAVRGALVSDREEWARLQAEQGPGVPL